MIQPATSRVRFRVLGFCVALAAITYMDRSHFRIGANSAPPGLFVYLQ